MTEIKSLPSIVGPEFVADLFLHDLIEGSGYNPASVVNSFGEIAKKLTEEDANDFDNANKRALALMTPYTIGSRSSKAVLERLGVEQMKCTSENFRLTVLQKLDEFSRLGGSGQAEYIAAVQAGEKQTSQLLLKKFGKF